MQNTTVKLLVEKALALLNKQYSETNEKIIKEFIEKYSDALSIISHNKQLEKKDFAKILNLTRMYAETSSNYSQNFLDAMYEVESYIKKIYKSN